MLTYAEVATLAEREHAHLRGRIDALNQSISGSQFTCFTGTKARILTQPALSAIDELQELVSPRRRQEAASDSLQHLCALPHTADAQQFAITSAHVAYSTHALAAQRHAAFCEQLSSVSSELYGVCQTEVPACISDLRTLQERAASADAAQEEQLQQMQRHVSGMRAANDELVAGIRAAQEQLTARYSEMRDAQVNALCSFYLLY